VTAEKLVFIPESDALKTISELIDMEHIPKQFGGEFEGTYGMLPELGEEYMKRLDWIDGVEKSIPAGPLKWVLEEGEKPTLVAVGTENGTERRIRLATMTINSA
jgi:hypothetical protein